MLQCVSDSHLIPWPNKAICYRKATGGPAVYLLYFTNSIFTEEALKRHLQLKANKAK